MSRADDDRPSPGRRGWYVASLFAFAAAMLAKGSVAVLPAVLLLIAWWRRGAVSRSDVVRTLPFFGIACVLTAVNVSLQSRAGAGEVRDAGFVERVLGAGAIVWFYAWKAVAPIGLAFVYPQWDVRVDDIRWWLPAIAAMVVTAVLVAYRRRPVARAILFGWAFFCFALVPVMASWTSTSCAMRSSPITTSTWP